MVCRLQNRPHFRGLAEIPCEIEPGIFVREPGYFRQADGKFSQRQLEGGALLDGGIEVVSHGGAVCAFPSRARARAGAQPGPGPYPRARARQSWSRKLHAVRSRASDEKFRD